MVPLGATARYLWTGTGVPRHQSFRHRAAEARDGMPFLKVRPGEVVAVWIVNHAGHDVGATVTVDGLSMFTFRDDKTARNENVIVRRHTAGEVLARFRNARRSSAFLVADLPRDHPRAPSLKSPAKIGAITVTFAAAWERDADRPKDDGGVRQATEIVPGALVDAPYETVRRQVGGFQAAVTVRFDKM